MASPLSSYGPSTQLAAQTIQAQNMKMAAKNAAYKTGDISETEKTNPKIEAAAKDFEAMFITEMIRPMMETVEVNDMFGGGKGEDVFRGFMVDEYGKKIAAAGGIGLARHISEAMIRAQEGQKGQ
jgi:flagellar protein FlgJ